MPYPEPLVEPMRAELVAVGVNEMRTAEEVDNAFEAARDKTMLLVVNSVCGCAAANARPAVRLSLQSNVLPDMFTTVFAGQDMEATARAREYMAGIPPSSPFIALIKNNDPVFVLERRHIQGRAASAIASDLVGAYATHCGTSETDASDKNGEPKLETETSTDLPPTFRSIL